MYNKKFNSSVCAGVASTLSRSDSTMRGRNQSFILQNTADQEESWNAVSPAPVTLVYIQAAGEPPFSAVAWQVVPLLEPSRGAPWKLTIQLGQMAMNVPMPVWCLSLTRTKTNTARCSRRFYSAPWRVVSSQFQVLLFSRRSLQFHSSVQVLKKNYEVTVKETKFRLSTVGLDLESFTLGSCHYWSSEFHKIIYKDRPCS